MSESKRDYSSEQPFTEEEIKELIKGKVPIEIKDNVMQIDKNHPDYDFLIED
ncbi:MAG TPA: hypothetical protein VK125_08295 [Bacillota bacterium]|nr:hypothetical protein [Bacillota bacterium]